MAAKDNVKNKPKSKGNDARKTTAAPKKKTAASGKKSEPKKTTASAGWKEKKAQIRQRSKEPKTIAERKALSEKGPIRRFFEKHNGLMDMAAVLVFAFAGLCLYSMASGNERPAAVWCTNFSLHLFGRIGYLFYFLVIVFCIRVWLRNIPRFKEIHYKRYLYFLGLIFFLGMALQYNANKHIPPLMPEENGGHLANLFVVMITNVLGSSGMLILLIFLMLFFVWHAWKFLSALEQEQKHKETEVPVRLYWENVHTAAEAEALESEKLKSEALTSDIATDFRSSIGLLTAEEARQENQKKNQEAGVTLRKLRDTFLEIAQPLPDKDAMIPKETKPSRRPAEAVPAKIEEKRSVPPAKKKSRPSADEAAQLSLAAAKAAAAAEEAPEEDLPPEPVFEEEPDHNGSGLLSAPAKPVKEQAVKDPDVQVRKHKVTLDEEKEKVSTTQLDYSFVPTIPAEDRKQGPADGTSSDPWILPKPEDILDPENKIKGLSPSDPALQAQAEKIERLLNTFGAPSSVVDIQCGPTFTQFGVEPGFVERGGRRTRVRIKQIETLQKDLEMKLSVKQLAIEAPIPGKTYVGIQVQNKDRIPVPLREVIGSDDFRAHKRELGIALGKDINGSTFGADLTRMPHLLIAGATNSGKSVCLNSILVCLLLNNSPERLKLILVDPKRVELTGYNGLPHLITPVVTDAEQVGNILQWVLREMDMRNLHFMENGVRNIQEYNRKFSNKKLPYIVIVIDELANLMMEAASDIENSIVRLAQTARAMGIHLIVATQRPSRDVITGTIKGNLPTRIAFAVASYVDSQVILDRPGAENLFGMGDMYFLSVEDTALKRLQCVFVSDNEIKRIVDYWKKGPRTDQEPENSDPDLVKVPQPVTQKVSRPPEILNGTLTQLPLFNESAPPLKTDEDRRYDEAVKMVQRAGRASASMLVSRMSIGYSRANKLLARMEEDGIIGPPNPNPAIPREILDYGEYGPENDAD